MNSSLNSSGAGARSISGGKLLSSQGRARRSRPKLNPAMWALAGLCAWAAPAHATITVISAVVAADGSGPFDADNAPGNDSGSNNGVVRTQDSVLYTINYNASNASNDTITVTLPAGMRWDPTATAASVCNGPGGGSLNGNVLTCNRQPSAAGVESFQVLGWVGNVAHGATVAMTAAAGGGSSVSASVTVSATPKTDTRVRVEVPNMTRVQSPAGSGIWMRSMQLAISLGAVRPASGNYKGYEALQSPVSATIKVQPGAVVLDCPAGASCSQSAPGADVTVQFNNPTTHFLDATTYPGFGDTWLQTAQYAVQIGVPENPNFPPGQISRISAQLTNFAPLGLSGQTNATPTPGLQPGFSCAPNVNLNVTQSCFNTVVDRTQPLLVGILGGAVYDGSSYIYGDNHGYTAGQEKVLPGQNFMGMVGIYNQSDSEQPATDVQSCVAWDPALLELRAAPSLKLASTPFFIFPHFVDLPDVAPADMVLEYSAQPYADNDARKAANCGVAGDGNSLWTSDYTSLPPNTITSVRYAYHPDLQPGGTAGLIMPFKRSTSAASLALADDAPLAWFAQYDTDATGLVYSRYAGNGTTNGNDGGGFVQTASALARHSLSMPNSVAPGAIFPISVTPRTVGAVGTGVDGVSRNVEITIDFPNTYIQPVASSIAAALPPGATYTLTAANLGADGLPGTGDAGEAPAKLVLHLGDLPAPGGAQSPGLYQGHVTEYPPITFQAQAAYISPVGSYPVVGLVTATNDLSMAADDNSATFQQDRTERASTTVSGVSGFEMSKSLVSGGTVDNTDPANPVTRVTAGEPFTYAISFGNATSLSKGQLRMVDVLPFDGDNRGTTGLGQLQMISAIGAMGGAGQGTIGIEYTTAAGAMVQAAVLTPGNEDANTGVAWTPYAGGAFPAGVTAFRFTTSSVLNPGFSGIVDLTMRSLSPLSPTTQLFNDVFGRELTPGGLVLLASGRVQLSGQAAASLTGTVFNDANMNNILDAGETGLAGVTATITCNAGPACTAGEAHSAVTNATGVYNFAPGATVDGQANFPGLASGSWTLSIAPDASWNNRGSVAGTVNGVASGNAAGRSISGIVVPTGAIAVDYVFSEHQMGSLTINKALALPAGVTGPFNFGFTATCDLPAAGTVYTAALDNYPTNSKVTIANVPVGANCTVVEDTPLPNAPANFTWAAPSVPAPVVVPATGTVAVGVTNALNSKLGNIVVNATTALPDGVTGPFSFVLTATCDLPTAGTTHSVTLTAPPGATTATIAGVQAGAQCTMTQTTPDAPVGYRWADPAFDQTTVTVVPDSNVPVALANRLTRAQVASAAPVPVDSRMALMLLAMLMMAAAGVRMRKR